MTSVMGSLNVGIAVVDRQLHVLAWNAKAQDLWGIRPDEAVRAHLFNLDIGLPLERLQPLLKKQLAGGNSDHDSIRLEAVNRRGRPLEVLVTVTSLSSDSQEPTGAIVVMDVIEDVAPAAGG
jgi:two-component system CheB/CheR fusion protein